MYIDDLWFYVNCVHLLVYLGDFKQRISYSNEDICIQTKIFTEALETIYSW
jgi:hypothetical protein